MKSKPTTALTHEITEMCGAVHIHTNFSDGGIDINELIRIAGAVGLDFILVSDHMTLQGKDEGYEGFHNDLLVIIGYEHNDSTNKNHYLAFGTDTVVSEQDKPQVYINEIKKAGGIGFLAHPAEERHYFRKYPSYQWTAWDVTGFDGIEIWNQMSEWAEHLRSWLSFIYIFYPRRFIHNAPQSLLKKWDRLNRTRFVSGIGGVDAHVFTLGKGLFSYKIFPMKVELKGIRTHVYVPAAEACNDYERDRDIFLTALKNGHGFISNFRRGDARGTKIYLATADGKIIVPGCLKRKPCFPETLFVAVPDKANIRLIKNGSMVQRVHGCHAEFVITEPGLYRIEVYKGKNAWIYSNPFPVGGYPLY